MHRQVRTDHFGLIIHLTLSLETSGVAGKQNMSVHSLKSKKKERIGYHLRIAIPLALITSANEARR